MMVRGRPFDGVVAVVVAKREPPQTDFPAGGLASSIAEATWQCPAA